MFASFTSSVLLRADGKPHGMRYLPVRRSINEGRSALLPSSDVCVQPGRHFHCLKGGRVDGRWRKSRAGCTSEGQGGQQEHGGRGGVTGLSVQRRGLVDRDRGKILEQPWTLHPRWKKPSVCRAIVRSSGGPSALSTFGGSEILLSIRQTIDPPHGRGLLSIHRIIMFGSSKKHKKRRGFDVCGKKHNHTNFIHGPTEQITAESIISCYDLFFAVSASVGSSSFCGCV